MATVAITIPDALVPRLTTAMRALFPQYASRTDVQCFKKITADHWAWVLANYEAAQAYNAQQAQSTSDASGIG
jgi:hypothetical protein